MSMDPDIAPAKELYLLVILSNEGTHVLLREDVSGYRFPELQVPKFTRVIEQITNQVHELWCLAAVVLAIQPVDQNCFYAVLEHAQSDAKVPRDFKWLAIENLDSGLSDEQKRTIRTCHAKAVALSPGAAAAPFSRLGWIYDLQTWVEMLAGTISGFLHVSGADHAALVRFERAQSPLWFKAVGEVDPQEYVNALLFSKLFTEYVPTILGFDDVRKGWLMEDGGETLRNHGDIGSWKTAARGLAVLQIKSVDHIPALCNAGCRDIRSASLLELITPFFELMHDLMQQQTKSSPAPLTDTELCELAAILREAIEELASLGIPDSLGHSDFNPGNILMRPEGCVFIDWYAAHIGNPLLTLEYLTSHRRNSGVTSATDEPALRETYAQCWLGRVAPEAMLRALQLSPLVAVYAYAISSNTWKNPERLARPGQAGYLRSLTRTMQREARSLVERREPCPM